VAYFDARYPSPRAKPKGGYDFYDASIHRAAKRVAGSGRMPVKIDATDKLFQPGDCPDAAFIAVWYSLANYIDAFKWKPGSVGYQSPAASATPCGRWGATSGASALLEKGAAPWSARSMSPMCRRSRSPRSSSGCCLEGHLTLAECYAVGHSMGVVEDGVDRGPSLPTVQGRKGGRIGGGSSDRRLILNGLEHCRKSVPMRPGFPSGAALGRDRDRGGRLSHI